MTDHPTVLAPKNIPQEIHQIVQAIADGRVKNAKMEWSDNGKVSFTADSADGGSRYIIEKQDFAGVRSNSETHIRQPNSREERLQRVMEMRKKGMTQSEIARFTMTSQKTVSNDIKELKSSGKLC